MCALIVSCPFRRVTLAGFEGWLSRGVAGAGGATGVAGEGLDECEGEGLAAGCGAGFAAGLGAGCDGKGLDAGDACWAMPHAQNANPAANSNGARCFMCIIGKAQTLA